jgi:tetratricopeptide (TPR) repeat protein
MKFEMIRQATPARRLAFMCALVCAACTASYAQRRPAVAPRGPAQPPPATQSPAAGRQDFDQLAAQATAAREGDRIDEAVAAYQKALAVRPQWAEGWWYLATLFYDRDDYEHAARAFAQSARLEPKAGAPWAMLGLCEFQLARYDDAYNHIEQGRLLGVGDNVELTRVMRYHEALLSVLKGDYERAQQTLGTLSFEGLKSEDLILSLGLSALRRGMLPRQVTPDYPDRDLIRRVGLAEHLAAQKNVADAQREYELVVRDYPKTPDLQYAFGRFLLNNRDDESALAAFQRELENYPKHALARLQIAYIKLKNRDAQAGLPYAEEAVKLYPSLPLSHFILGRILLETGQQARAVQELETTRRMASDYAPVYFQLSRAYAKLNRKEEAERARETFVRLNKQAEDAAGAQAVPADNEAGGGKPPQS